MTTSSPSSTPPAECDPFGLEDDLRSAPRPVAGQRSSISEFYRGRNVLITGASGFVGKVLVEKLLRTCPGIGKIYVLVRPKRGKAPSERVRELLESHLFDGVRQINLEERVLVVEGDVSQQHLGLSSYNLARITKEVSVIFHSAATVKFDEPLKQSVSINIAGTKHIIELCRRVQHLAGLVHVSTAYANCDLDSVDEHVYPVDMDPEKLIQMADWLDQDTMQQLRDRLLGARPNTYTYTKALAEWLLIKSARDLPIAICRPSIVVASSCEPFRGWIDNVNGPTGVVLGAGKGLIRSMYAENECVADLVPVDKVINLIVTLGWFAHKYRQANRSDAEHERHRLEESLADSLIGSSASASSAAGSSAASTSGESLEEDQSSGDLSLVGSETSSSSSPSPDRRAQQKEDEANNHLFEVGPLDDGYGSRSPHYSGSSASSSLSRRHRQLSDAESDDKLQEDQECETQVQARVRVHLTPAADELTTPAAATTTATTTTTSTNTSTTSDDLTASNLCDINQQAAAAACAGNEQMRRRRRRTFSSGAQQRQQAKLLQADDGAGLDNNNLNSAAHGELEYKMKQFRQKQRAKLRLKGMPEELGEIPVFHCTSGSENPITWGQVQLFILAALTVFPSSSTYRYPRGAFTNNERLDNFYRITLHYIPGYIVDFVIRLMGGKPMIVPLFKKFDQAAQVLKAFTSREWHFDHDNRLFLMDELMGEEDKRLFDCDIKSLNWREFMSDYAAGVRKFLLKEPVSTLQAARKNLSFVYYRNLSIQLITCAATTYYLASSIGLIN